MFYHEVITSGRNASYSGQSLSQATRDQVRRKFFKSNQMELPGGLVLAIAGTSSAKTIPSPLETFVILSILLNKFKG
jgi:hypothetical protein